MSATVHLMNSVHFCSYVIYGALTVACGVVVFSILNCPSLPAQRSTALTYLLLLPVSLLTLTYPRHHKWTRPKSTVDCVVFAYTPQLTILPYM